MTENARVLTPAIRAHLQGLLRSSGLPDTPERLEEMTRIWFAKKEMFEGQVAALDMLQLTRLSADDPRGALLLTWSGSLLSMGPAADGRAGRRMEYASIELRTDVPHLAVADGGQVETGLAVGEPATLRGGPIASTSALLTIAACDPSVTAEEQEKRIREATIFLTNGFVKINRTVTRPGVDFPEQLTLKTIVTYLARKNELSQKQTRQLLDDYHTMLESGLLLGLRVPVGKIGRLSLRKKPARKARVGINPATGGALTVKARPEEQAPRMAFSRLLKDRARQAGVPDPSSPAPSAPR